MSLCTCYKFTCDKIHEVCNIGTVNENHAKVLNIPADVFKPTYRERQVLHRNSWVMGIKRYIIVIVFFVRKVHILSKQ